MVLMVVCALVALGIHILLCYICKPTRDGRSGNGRAMVLPEQPGLNFNDRQESQIELQKTPGVGNQAASVTSINETEISNLK